MKCPFCHVPLIKDADGYYTCYTDNCPSLDAGGVGPSGTDSLWLKLTQLQDEIIYIKGLNCPTVVEKQMQTITTCGKRLDVAVAALKEIVTNPHGAACHNYVRAKEALKEIEYTKDVK